jgi:hypothetical protein
VCQWLFEHCHEAAPALRTMYNQARTGPTFPRPRTGNLPIEKWLCDIGDGVFSRPPKEKS